VPKVKSDLAEGIPSGKVTKKTFIHGLHKLSRIKKYIIKNPRESALSA
jgi:hypothetical protein